MAGNNNNSNMNTNADSTGPAVIPTIDVVGVDDEDEQQHTSEADGTPSSASMLPEAERGRASRSQAPRAQGQDDDALDGPSSARAHTPLTITVPRIRTDDDNDNDVGDDGPHDGDNAFATASTAAAVPSNAAAASSATPGSPSHPQGILLDVPASSSRARARSGSGSGSVQFSPSLSPSRTAVHGDDASALSIPPPSPTLSAVSSLSGSQSGPTSVVLRENQPTAQSGLGSLSLLHPLAYNGQAQHGGHMRRGSAATFTTLAASDAEHGGGDKAEPGSPSSTSAYPRPSHSRRTSVTIAESARPEGDGSGGKSTKGDATSDDHHHHAKGAKSGKNGKNGADGHDGDGAPRPPPRLEETTEIDTGPFSAVLQPVRLAELVDPKSLDKLVALGGVDALLQGLGTDPKRGLCGLGKDVDRNHDTPHPHPHRGHNHEEEEDGGGAGDYAGRDPYAAPLSVRRRVYGANALPPRPSKTLLQLMWLAFKDKVLLMLTAAAVVALALGLFQDFGTQRPTFSCGNGQTCTEPPVDWVEGVAIMVAVAIVVCVGSLNDWQKEKQFRKLNDKKEDRTVKVIRDGAEKVINVKDVVVGDVALLEPGEIIPCDGVFLSGHNVKCDESAMNGESDVIKKHSPAECAEAPRNHTDCFVVSGSKVLEGVGSYVVIAVGRQSFSGRITMALRTGDEHTPMQEKLNHLAEVIAKFGLTAGILLFAALFIRFIVQVATNNPQQSANEKGLAFVQILIIAVTLVVVAVPEGLPLAVTLALAFATKRMTAENLLVRVLGSCETMANASVVCTDKTGTLTQNEMTVVAGSVGIHAKFVQRLAENQARTNAGDARERGMQETAEEQERRRKHPDDFSLDQARLDTVLSPALRRLFNEAITVNSTAFEDADADTGERRFVGSKTETALLKFAKELGWADYSATRAAAEVVQMVPFSSERKAMGVVVKTGKGCWRLYLKGASEILTKKCTRHVVVARPGEAKQGAEDAEVETKAIDEQAQDNISRTIIFYANQTLRTIALCYRDLEQWPPAGCDGDENSEEVPYELLARELTLIGITGIEDPLRPGVREAVAACTRAGVRVKMCTGDNVLTARSIALQCGIFTPGGLIMEGPAFRALSEREKREVVPRLQVLARSSPGDKKTLVEMLRGPPFGEIVGVTGDGTNDGPALKAAHVGFSMGIAGTETAKEASDIILMDDNFASIVKAIMWGRCVNDAVRKFLQFQISTNVTAVLITFVTAVASASETSALTAVQLLWINIIMDTFAALALATDPASPALLERKPDRPGAPLFNVDMYKQIIGQSIYQTIVILVFHFAGNAIFGYVPDPNNQAVQRNNTAKLNTLVFNAFVFAQIFNSINCRRIDSKKNVFEGMSRNWYFIAVTLIEIGVQVLIVFVGGSAFQVTKINGRDWAISLALGVMSLPLGYLIRCIPNKPCERALIKCRLLQDPEALPIAAPAENLPLPLGLLRDSLQTFSSVRGGRARASSFVSKSSRATAAAARLGAGPGQSHPRPAHSLLLPPPRKKDPAAERRVEEAGVRLPGVMAMVPGIVASSIGAGWGPHQAPPQASSSDVDAGGAAGGAPWAGSLEDPAAADPSRSSAALWEGKVQLHPETNKDDPAYKKWGFSLGAPIGDVGGAEEPAPSREEDDQSNSKLNLDAADNV